MRQRQAVLALILTVAVTCAGLPADTPTLSDTQKAAHLLNRFAFGPRPGDVDQVNRLGRDAWFERQLKPSNLRDDLPREPRMSDDPKKAVS